MLGSHCACRGGVRLCTAAVCRSPLPPAGRRVAVALPHLSCNRAAEREPMCLPKPGPLLHFLNKPRPLCALPQTNPTLQAGVGGLPRCRVHLWRRVVLAGKAQRAAAARGCGAAVGGSGGSERRGIPGERRMLAWAARVPGGWQAVPAPHQPARPYPRMAAPRLAKHCCAPGACATAATRAPLARAPPRSAGGQAGALAGGDNPPAGGGPLLLGNLAHTAGASATVSWLPRCMPSVLLPAVAPRSMPCCVP